MCALHVVRGAGPWCMWCAAPVYGIDPACGQTLWGLMSTIPLAEFSLTGISVSLLLLEIPCLMHQI